MLKSVFIRFPAGILVSCCSMFGGLNEHTVYMVINRCISLKYSKVIFLLPN